MAHDEAEWGLTLPQTGVLERGELIQAGNDEDDSHGERRESLTLNHADAARDVTAKLHERVHTGTDRARR